MLKTFSPTIMLKTHFFALMTTLPGSANVCYLNRPDWFGQGKSGQNRHRQIQGVSASPVFDHFCGRDMVIILYWNIYICEHILRLQSPPWSHAVTIFLIIVQGQGLKTYDVTFPAFFKFILSWGWKARGPTFSKILLFSWSGVWKPRALDVDIKPDYPRCRGWIPGS